MGCFCSFHSLSVNRQGKLSSLEPVCPCGTVLVRGGGVHFLLSCRRVGGGTQFQEHLAPVWGVLFPLWKQLGWVSGSCAAFPLLEQLKTFLGRAGTDAGTLHPSSQCAARAEPATGATSLPLYLEIKTEIKHRNGRQGLWMLICGVCVCLSGLLLYCGNCFGKRGSPDLGEGWGTGAHFWCCFLLEKQIKSSGREANA